MAGTMSSTMEYRQLLKGLDRQNRPPPPPPPPANAPPVRARGRARAMYPGNGRTRSMEPLGSIDEIVMDSDFSDSAVSPPPPSQRHRRPSTPRNFSRPDPINFPLRLSRDQDKGPTTNGTTTRMPVRGGKTAANSPPQSGIQAMSAFHAGDPLPDEPTFDDEHDSENDGPYRSPRRPQVYSNQRYEKRPVSAKGQKSPSTRSPILTPAKSAWERTNGVNGTHDSRSNSRATSRMSDETIKPRPLSAAAINQTAPLPRKSPRNNMTRFPSNTRTTDQHDYAERGNPQAPPQQRILKRISLDQHSEHYEPSSYVDLPIGINNLKSGPTNTNKSDKDLSSNNHLRPTRPTPKSSTSNTSTSKSSSHRSNSSSSNTREDGDRPPCWAGSDFDFNSVLTEKEVAKLKKKGINPALYAEMQAAKKGGKEGGSKGRKWIGPLVGNTYSG